ncbi:hypothetical protein R85157_000601 [Carnimonas sp. R-85157]
MVHLGSVCLLLTALWSELAAGGIGNFDAFFYSITNRYCYPAGFYGKLAKSISVRWFSYQTERLVAILFMFGCAFLYRSRRCVIG